MVRPEGEGTSELPIWQVLARWVSENLAFGSLDFFPTLWAVNVSWHEAMKGSVYSYAEPKGRWS